MNTSNSILRITWFAIVFFFTTNQGLAQEKEPNKSEDRVDAFARKLARAEAANTLPETSSDLFDELISICQTANESEVEELVRRARDNARIRLLVFCIFPTPFIGEHGGGSPPWNRKLKSHFYRTIIKQLRKDRDFRRDYVQFFRWTDGMRLPDLSDSQLVTDTTIFKTRVAIARDHAPKLTSDDEIYLICFSEVFSCKTLADGTKESIENFMKQAHYGMYQRDKSCTKYVLVEELKREPEDPSKGPQFAPLRRPILPFPNMDQETLKFLEICISDIHIFSEYQTN